MRSTSFFVAVLATLATVVAADGPAHVDHGPITQAAILPRVGELVLTLREDGQL